MRQSMDVTYWVAASIDGYIARRNGDVSWLDELGIPPEESGYEAFYSTVDALVMGRKTYEIIQGFGTWPYDDKPTWVCSRGTVAPIEGSNLQEATSPDEAVEAASRMNLKHLWLVGGGVLAAEFISKSLLTSISITQVPVILGNGIRLIGSLEHSSTAKLEDCRSKPSGLVQIEYAVTKA